MSQTFKQNEASNNFCGFFGTPSSTVLIDSCEKESDIREGSFGYCKEFNYTKHDVDVIQGQNIQLNTICINRHDSGLDSRIRIDVKRDSVARLGAISKKFQRRTSNVSNPLSKMKGRFGF